MKALYLRIWLTVVATLALFALTSGWLLQRHLQQERTRAEAVVAERMAGLGELIQNSLPERTASVNDQASALREWSHRLRVPLALSDHSGNRIAESDSYTQLSLEGRGHPMAIQLDDGRKLWLMRPPLRVFRDGPVLELRGDGPLGTGRLPGGFEGRPPRQFGPGGEPLPPLGLLPLPGLPRDWPAGLGLVILLAMLFLAVAAGAYPLVRGLTRRLEALKLGVETFGAGALGHRVDERGRDEVAAVAASFNRAADRIQSLLQANQSLLANASHELRSPLARLKMAVAMLDGSAGDSREALRREIGVNIAELDALVEEVLLSSRLESGAALELDDPVELLGLLAEEAARVQAPAEGSSVTVRGNERLLRRALRNLLENARRYGGSEVQAMLLEPGGAVELHICDRGPGVPEAERERIFEPFYRLPGHAEREGGVGLGLALVRQIARRHGGEVRCVPREDGMGSCFIIHLPAAARWAAAAPGA